MKTLSGIATTVLSVLIAISRSGKMLLVFCLSITPAWAGGLYVREFGQPSHAAAGAGGNVFAEDASTAFQNPSGLFNLENDSSWMVTGVVVDSKVEFETTNATTVPGDDGGMLYKVLGAFDNIEI
jgi:hypothetical protein